MKYYSLLESGSNIQIALFEWDDIASGSITTVFTPPSGTYLAEVPSGSEFTSSLSYDNIVNVGEYHGIFSGSVNILSGSVDNLSGSFVGRFTGTGSLVGGFKGILDGTASYAQLAQFAISSSTVQVFETSSVWTKPYWAKTVKVVCVGGGGGGGGSVSQYYLNNSGDFFATGGGGGGGGTVSWAEFDASMLPTSSIFIQVGAGGIGGSGSLLESGGNIFVDDFSLDGGDGGASKFGEYLVAPGGNGGSRANMYEDIYYVPGGAAKSPIPYINSGGGPGGMGALTSSGYPIQENDGYLHATIQSPYELSAPNLPLAPFYLQFGDYFPYGYLSGNIPNAVAPTGGGGGIGCIRVRPPFVSETTPTGSQGGISKGGSIVEESYDPLDPNLNLNIFFTQGVANSNFVTGSLKKLDGGSYFPFYNTKVGLGGIGGIASASIENLSYTGTSNGPIPPTPGGDYGGGGGGAYGGGPDLAYEPFIGFGNVGGNGGSGAVIIICES